MTEHVALPPPTTVADLLDQLPGGMPVLVDGYEAAYSPIATAALTEVQELSGRPSYLGRFEHPADAARAVAGDDAAAWAISEPGPLPELVGEPTVALVLRRARFSLLLPIPFSLQRAGEPVVSAVFRVLIFAFGGAGEATAVAFVGARRLAANAAANWH